MDFDVRVHDRRHTYASWLLAGGSDLNRWRAHAQQRLVLDHVAGRAAVRLCRQGVYSFTPLDNVIPELHAPEIVIGLGGFGVTAALQAGDRCFAHGFEAAAYQVEQRFAVGAGAVFFFALVGQQVEPGLVGGYQSGAKNMILGEW